MSVVVGVALGFMYGVGFGGSIAIIAQNDGIIDRPCSPFRAMALSLVWPFVVFGKLR
jgi:hypothetical protein